MSRRSPTPLTDPSLPVASPAAPSALPASGANVPVVAGLGPLARAALVLASVALLRLCFAPFGLAPLGLVATWPLLAALDGLTPRRAALVGLGWGIVGGAVHMHWLFQIFPGALNVLAPLCWLLFGLWAALYAWGHAIAARRGPVALAVFGPALWIAVEWLRSEASPIPFSWFTLGHALAGDRWVRQDADLAGVYGLSLLAYGTSFVLWRAWQLRRDGRGFVLGLFAVVIPLLLWSRGANILGVAPPLGSIPEGRHGVRVVVVQDERLSELEPKLALTRAAVAAAGGPVDLIVWPEGAVPPWSIAPGYERSRLDEIAALTSGAFVCGSFEEVKTPGAAPGSYWNSAVLLRPDGSTEGLYHKRVPVPFAEDVVAGHEAPVFEIPTAGAGTTQVGVFICYDGTLSYVARELVQNGAQLLLTPSMDMESWGLVEHLEHASFYPLRACELRRPIARASSSGVSLVLDPWGRELARIDPTAPGMRSAVVVPETVLTPYVRGGWLLPHVALGLVALGAALLLAARVRA